MKKFLYEYKSYKVKSETEIAKEKSKRERITLTSRRTISPTREEQNSHNDSNVGTIRTEEYKRDLAEFQARRSSGQQEQDSPKRKCRHSLSGCTDCATDPDRTFNYEKKSATKYKKKRARSASEDVPNIQFLFQNQVFMPGNNMFPQATYSEPYKPTHRYRTRDLTQKHIDFKEDSPPLVYKNNSLPFDVRNFVSSSSGEEVDGVVKTSDCSKDSGDRLLEVMSELRSFDQWADEQLKIQSPNSSRVDDCQSDASSYGLPVVSSSDVDVTVNRGAIWSPGRWGAIPVQVRKLPGVAIQRAKRHPEINILRKCRHPNIILLMGVFSDIENNVNLICERCVDTLYNIIHVQGRMLTAQTSVQYACDVANALVFLRMRGYVHTSVNSRGIVVTSRDAAKLCDAGGCEPVQVRGAAGKVDPYSRYENIGEARASLSQDCEPLLSARSSEDEPDLVICDVTAYVTSENFRWLAPELFSEEDGRVKACGRTSVYSLALVLWECCNSTVPWRTLSYDKLKEQYTLWETGIRLPSDGVYPGALLALLQEGLRICRRDRPALDRFADRLGTVKQTLDKMEYIIIPARLKKNQSDFSSVWERGSFAGSPAHDDNKETSSESDKESNAIYETLEKPTYATVEKCYLSEDETDRLPSHYEKLRGQDYSSACSTPISKIRAKVKDMGTPITLHRSDSTEYNSIRSPDSRHFGKSFDGNNNSTKSTAKFSKSFTPQSYKPLHIKVPEFNLDSFSEMPKDSSGTKPCYNFDIKNYSLPNTPIARSNKLRKNAWLSGDLSEKSEKEVKMPEKEVPQQAHSQQSAPDTPRVSTNSSIEKDNDVYSNKTYDGVRSPESAENRDHFVSLNNGQQNSSPSASSRERTHSWSFKTTERSPKQPDTGLSHVNVKPLVAIHERWIYEANRKTGRSMSLPEENRSAAPAVKPASHIVDPWQKSLPQLNMKKKKFIKPPLLQSGGTNGLSEQYRTARDRIARCMNFAKDHERVTWKKEAGKCITPTEDIPPPPPPPPIPVTKVDQTTDTSRIDEFIRDIIRKELRTMLKSESPDHSDETSRSEEFVNKGVSNVMDALQQPDESKKTFSRLKINGNNKTLLQITFSRNGENSLRVMDSCVNVTFGDKASPSLERQDSSDPPPSPENGSPHLLKRCQTFNALQEARSTEDLYIDDELSSHMADSFGRRPPPMLELHELLCPRQEDCCLVKVKQENGCDSLYFRCDSDTESRDAPDGADTSNSTLVYKRSISLIEERFERVPKSSPIPKRKQTITTRPKSEVFQQKFNKETRLLSSSSPSLSTIKDDVEVNIENVMSYDSSSDECLKCQAEDDFELLEREIEKEVNCGLSCLGKISEEDLSLIKDESEKEISDDECKRCESV